MLDKEDLQVSNGKLDEEIVGKNKKRFSNASKADIEVLDLEGCVDCEDDKTIYEVDPNSEEGIRAHLRPSDM